jgi:hypothetical protein
MKFLLPMLLLIGSNTYAEENMSDLALVEDSIESPALNIEGQYHEKEVLLKEEPKKEVRLPKRIQPKPLSPSERLRLKRAELEIRNQLMVQKKMEQIRLQQELALAKKLEQSMNQTIQAIDASLK